MVKIVFDMEIQNTQECFVRLWLWLERTRQLFEVQKKLFCVRRVLQSWFGAEATDDFIWEVCNLASRDEKPIYGYDILPNPSLYPRKHREILKAIVQKTLNLNKYQVKLNSLDKAYSIAFPLSTPININKKKRTKRNRYVR